MAGESPTAAPNFEFVQSAPTLPLLRLECLGLVVVVNRCVGASKRPTYPPAHTKTSLFKTLRK